MAMVIMATGPGRGGRYRTRMLALRGEAMRDWGEQPEAEGGRPDRAARETGQTAKDLARRERYLAREHALEEAAKARAAERAEERGAEEITQLAKDQVRREAYSARERAMAEAREARRTRA